MICIDFSFAATVLHAYSVQSLVHAVFFIRKSIKRKTYGNIGYQCTVNNNALKTRYCEEKYIMNSYDKFWMILRQLQKEAKLQCL